MSKPKKSNAIPPDLQIWIEVRRRRHLSHAHVQMARELGMNPKRMGKIDNHKQEPWKAPLPIFIEDLYYKRFGRERPETVVTIEQRARQIAEKKAARRAAKAARRAVAQRDAEAPTPSGGALPSTLSAARPSGEEIDGSPGLGFGT
jgi:hypothetical protein